MVSLHGLHGNRKAKAPGKELDVRARVTCCSQPTLNPDRRDSSVSVVGLQVTMR